MAEEKEAPGGEQPAGAASSTGGEQAQPQARGPTGRAASAYATRNLTEGSIPKNLWFLAWPQAAEGVLNIVDQMADLFWAGQGFGVRGLAGVGAAWSWASIPMSGRQGLDTAMRAMVSRAVGAGDMALANHIVLQSFSLSMIIFAVIIAAGLVLSEAMLRLVSVPEEIVGQIGLYMRLLFIGVGFLGMRMMTAAALQSAGDPLTPMRATMATRVVRMTLTPVLGFGFWIFPDMGLAGFGMAMILAQITGAIMNFYALFAGTSRLHLSLRNYRIDPPLLWRLMKIGVPASVTSVQLSVSQIIMLGLVSPFGITAIGAYTLVQRAQQFANMGTMGLGQAAGILVGQNLGAKKPERAKQTVVWAIGYSIVMQGLFGLFLVTFPTLFISVFNNDPDLLSLAETWLRIQVLGYLAMGAGLIFAQSFNTAGDTVPPAVVSVVTVWAVQLPLALILPDVGNLGPLGIAWAMVIGLSVRLLFYVPYFLSGRWLRVKVI